MKTAKKQSEDVCGYVTNYTTISWYVGIIINRMAASINALLFMCKMAQTPP